MRKSVAQVEAHDKATTVIGVLGLVAALMLPGCQTQPTPEPIPDNRQITDESTEQKPACPELPERDIERQAIEMLDQGESEDARELLECIVADNPYARRANSLIRQLDADPVAYLGAGHYMYTVQSSETLSKIAGERLGNPLGFVILARYNDIPVPANLVAGQGIKIPGEKPAPTPTTMTPPPVDDEPDPVVAPDPAPPVPSTDQAYDEAIAMEQQGDLDGAYRALERIKSADPQRAGIDVPTDEHNHAVVGVEP